MDFAQVYGCLNLTWGRLRSWDFYAHMQLKAVIPDQRTGPAILRQIKRQDQRGTTFVHWQDNPPLFLAHRLSRPGNRIEAFLLPGIVHPHLWMFFAECAGGCDVGNKHPHDGLYRLAMQRKATFHKVAEVLLARPNGLPKTCLLMRLHALVPDMRRFHLSGFQSIKLACRQVNKSIHTYGLHAIIVAWMSQFCKWAEPGIPTIRLLTTWYGYQSPGGRSLRARCKRKQNACFGNVVSDMGLRCWHWKRTSIISTSS